MATTRRYVVKNGLDNNSNSIINVSDPTNDSDAATKNFAKNADNLTSGTVVAARMPALSGDVTTTIGTISTTIAAKAVTLSKMADLAASSIIGNNTASPATPLALSASDVKTLLSLTSSDVGLGNVTNVAQIPSSYLDTDVTLAANSNTKVATQAAVKAYADGLIGANDAMQYKGVIDCSTNPNYPAANAGHTYKVSVAGKIGGASGPNVEIGDTLICTTDNTVSGTQAAVGANWNIIQANIDGAVTGPTSSTSGNFASFNGVGGKIIQDSGVSASSFVTPNSSPSFSGLTIGTLSGILKATTGSVSAASAGSDYVSPTDNVLPLTNGKFASATLTTSTTTADQVVDTAAIATYRTVKYLIQVTSGSAYQTTEVLLIHDGSTVYITEYATVLTGTNLATFNADINTGNLRLLTTPVNAVTVYKVIRTAIFV